MASGSLRHRSGLRLARRNRLLNAKIRGLILDAAALGFALASLLVAFCAGAGWR